MSEKNRNTDKGHALLLFSATVVLDFITPTSVAWRDLFKIDVYVAKKKNFTELKKVFTMAIRILKKASKYDVIKVKSVVLLIFL